MSWIQGDDLIAHASYIVNPCNACGNYYEPEAVICPDCPLCDICGNQHIFQGPLYWDCPTEYKVDDAKYLNKHEGKNDRRT